MYEDRNQSRKSYNRDRLELREIGHNPRNSLQNVQKARKYTTPLELPEGTNSLYTVISDISDI